MSSERSTQTPTRASGPTPSRPQVARELVGPVAELP